MTAQASASRVDFAPPPAAAADRAHRAHRADIEGLRAVAVTLVVVGHAGIGWLAGGYVGVDVFFVISGFLITSLLMREASATGRIQLGRFYARRAIRLLPASTVVAVATLAGSWLWLSPVRAADYAHDALASALYAINMRLAALGTDYFAAELSPSPYQHYWSLAVEEQFYVVWPLLIIVVLRIGSRRLLYGVLGALTVTSFLVSVVETYRAAPWAYFGTHARAWELGAGALVALLATRLSAVPARLAAAITWTGLGAVLTAALLYDDATRFPGTAAALPVAGAAMIVAGGCAGGRLGAERILRLGPFQRVGALSYGWYLWHWPILLIVPSALGIAPGVAANLGLCAVALGLAALSLRWVENPVRYRSTLRVRPARGIGLGLFLSAVTAAAAVGMAAVPPAVRVGGDAQDVRAAVGGAIDPVATLRALVAEAEQRNAIPRNLTPSLTRVDADRSAIYDDGCQVSIGATKPPAPCEYGDRRSDTTVVLIGDSHAGHWFPALERLATAERWRLVSMTKVACPPADLLAWFAPQKRDYPECSRWRGHAMQRIRDLAPDLVVVAASTNYRPAPGTDPADWARTWDTGWARTFRSLRRTARHVVVLADTPRLRAWAPECLARHPRRVSACGVPRARALIGPALQAAIAENARRSGVVMVDPMPWLCGDRRCPVVVGNVLVYADAHHLTPTFAALLADVLRTRLPDPRSG